MADLIDLYFICITLTPEGKRPYTQLQKKF